MRVRSSPLKTNWFKNAMTGTETDFNNRVFLNVPTTLPMNRCFLHSTAIAMRPAGPECKQWLSVRSGSPELPYHHGGLAMQHFSNSGGELRQITQITPCSVVKPDDFHAIFIRSRLLRWAKPMILRVFREENG